MGDIDDLGSLSTLTSKLQSIDPNTKLSNSRVSKVGGLNSESLSNALTKAVNILNKDDSKKKKVKTTKLTSADEEDFSAGLSGKERLLSQINDDEDGDDDSFDYGDGNDDDNYDDDELIDSRENQIHETKNQSSSSKRRRAPESDFENENNNEFNLFEEFSKKKKEFISKKAKHYQIDQRIGGHEDILEDPIDHRAASYEIMTNRGLRPHRKKSNRNPRVKKREAYDKAILKRKSQVREGDSGSNRVSYGGELTGIKANLSRSRRFDS